jgi:NADPH:quinone reductase-like Zn-dependent oxidoreductase
MEVARVRAIGFTEFGGPEVLKVIELEEPHAGEGEVRIRARAAAVNPSDSVSRSGAGLAIWQQYDPQFEYPPPPYLVGWDIAGIVDEIGPGTDTDLAIGDRAIAITTPMSERAGYAEYVVAPIESVVPAPKNVDDVTACTLPMSGLTARLALDTLALPAGATVAVTGAAGTIGGYVVQLAKVDGLRVVADAAPADETLVKELGADWVVPRGDDVAHHIRAVISDGVDALVDSALQGDVVAAAVRDRGSVVALRPHIGPTDRGISWRQVFIMDYQRDRARLDQLRRQVESGALTLRVAGTYPAEQAEQAHRRMEAGGVRGRLVLTF